MPRYRLILEYDGSAFVGWQRQAQGLSCQEALEEALRLASGETGSVIAAGRTDSGVHALGQAAHLDLSKPWPTPRLREALNFHLRPWPLAVLEAEEVAPGFHARFDALERRYLYRIVTRRSPMTLLRSRAWWRPRPLDAAAMAEAARYWIGKQDFSSFRAAGCQAKTPIRTLRHLSVQREGEEIRILAAAPSFLHHQVRNLVGSLALVGEGQRPPLWAREVLLARDRRLAGPTAPPEGLYFLAVAYRDRPLPPL